MKKKIMTIAMIGALLCTAFTGCGKKNDVADNKTDGPVVEQTVDNSKADETEAEPVVEETVSAKDTVIEQIRKNADGNDVTEIIAAYENNEYFDFDNVVYNNGHACNVITIDKFIEIASANPNITIEDMDTTMVACRDNVTLCDKTYYAPGAKFEFEFSNSNNEIGTIKYQDSVHIIKHISITDESHEFMCEYPTKQLYLCEYNGLTGIAIVSFDGNFFE